MIELKIISEAGKESAQAEIAYLQKAIASYEAEKNSRKIPLKMSITGVLWRVYKRNSGFTLAQIRRHYGDSLEEFCKNYDIAQKSFNEGDMETVQSFFNIYT